MNIMKCFVVVTLASFTLLSIAVAQDRNSPVPFRLADSNRTIPLSDNHRRLVPLGTEAVDATTVTRNGQEYTVVKYRDFDDNSSRQIILNSSGQRTNRLPEFKRAIIGKTLSDSIAKDPLREVPVSVLLKLPENLQQWKDTRAAKVTSSAAEDDEIKYFIDEKEVSRVEVLEETKGLQVIIENHEKKVADYLKSARTEFVQLNAIENAIFPSDIVDERIVLLNQNAQKIQDIANNQLFEIDSIELYIPPQDDIIPGMQWTNIWAHARFGQHQGNNIGIWQTENGCPPNGFFSNYNRLSGPPTPHSQDMATIIRTVSPLAFITCRGGPLFPTNGQANNAVPQIQVVTRSNSAINGRAYTGDDRTWDNRIYNSMIPATQSAGNNFNGTSTFNVNTPAKAVNAITVGNVDISVNPDVIWWESRWINGTLGNEKPELSAPGGSGTGTTLPAPRGPTGGTSAATAHTGGFVANLMDFDASLIRNPQRTKALMLSGATNPVVGGTTKVGVGGIDYRNTSQDYQTYNFDGPNSNWSQFDLFTDGVSDNVITVTRWLQNNKPNVRASISWLNRGGFVLNNMSLSTDYDLEVFDPNNNYVGGSHSVTNPFESVDFTASLSGFYKFKIRRFANPDPASRVGLALAVNFDN